MVDVRDDRDVTKLHNFKSGKCVAGPIGPRIRARI